jgi:glycosyltransferase involved in cell wall biosynthesis
MSISVITISYNQGAFLRAAAESVLRQDVDVQYIVIDAGSTERETLKVLEWIERQPGTRVNIGPDDGPADGLNKGFEMAEMAIVGYLNSDDTYLPGALAQVCSNFARFPSADVIYGNGFIVDIEHNPKRHVRSDPFGLRDYALGAGMVLQQATFFRKEALPRNPFNVSNKTCWDGELLVDLALAGRRLVHIDSDWGCFRIHPQSITGSKLTAERYKRDHDRVAAKILGYEPSTRPLLKVEGIARRLRRRSRNLFQSTPRYPVPIR